MLEQFRYDGQVFYMARCPVKERGAQTKLRGHKSVHAVFQILAICASLSKIMRLYYSEVSNFEDIKPPIAERGA